MAAFTFIDLFAGIGGIRIALEKAGGRCVMTSEWNRFSRKTYEGHFGVEDHFRGDITEIPLPEIPEHDLLAGGFPCQPFSLAGVSKKNSLGRSHGFDDPDQGTLFFNIKSILKTSRPRAFLLENVKNLRSHDKGRTWRVIQQSLTDVGYSFTSNLVDASSVVPQHRERIFIVGFRSDIADAEPGHYLWETFWEEVGAAMGVEYQLQRALYKAESGDWPRVGHILEDPDDVPDRYTLGAKTWSYLQEHRRKHEEKGNGFGYSMVDENTATTRTMSARYHKDGSEILVSRGPGEIPRRLTPLECARLQGFPPDFQAMFDRGNPQPVSDTQAYKQFGNSVAVPVVRAIASVVARYLKAFDLVNGLSDIDDQMLLWMNR